jgi:hypothetical protein
MILQCFGSAHAGDIQKFSEALSPTSVVQEGVYKEGNRPMDKIVTFIQKEISGHEPQLGLDTKTDIFVAISTTKWCFCRQCVDSN